MVYKVNHNQTFNMLIDNPIGKEYDPESNAVSPVTTIFRKYHNKEDDVLMRTSSFITMVM